MFLNTKKSKQALKKVEETNTIILQMFFVISLSPVSHRKEERLSNSLIKLSRSLALKQI